MQLNWEAIGAVGEVLGALGVIATLGYLAVQIRQNSRMLRSTTYQSAIQSMSEFTTALIADRELMRLFVTGRKDLNAIKSEDRDIFTTILLNMFYNYESHFYQLQDGTLNPEIWEGRHRFIQRIIQEKGTAEWWAQSKWLFGTQFQDYVDRQRTEEVR